MKNKLLLFLLIVTVGILLQGCEKKETKATKIKKPISPEKQRVKDFC